MATTSDAMAVLGDLHRSGRLAGQYPRVRGLLADLPPDELARAGLLLARLDPDEVLKEHPEVPALTVAVTGHGTLPGLVAAATAELARHGLLMRSFAADFDGYVFDLGDPRSELYAAEPDLVLCVLDPMVVFDRVPSPWRVADVEAALESAIGVVERLAGQYRSTGGGGTLVLNTMPLLRRFAAQLVDHRSRARLGAVWRAANARLLGLAEEDAAVVVLDLDPIIAEGVTASDARHSLYAGAHLSSSLLARYAREVGHLARHRAGLTKKALAVDLDGTLWGGVLGEDGPDGIEVADGRRGAAFQDFQRLVKQIGSQGVLLAAVSKNDPEPVRAVLRDHPGLAVREDDFVRVVANWRPKHDNLAELAAALNLGVDSFVFADDSPYECGLVRHGLPGVAVVRLDGEPARHAEALLADGWFAVPELTADDRDRGARYKQELVRKDFLDAFDSIDDYLRELRVRVRLSAAREADAARLSQLTLRTNQFNMTTERLQPADVARLVEAPWAMPLAVRAEDRFGDNGLVGAVFLRREGAAVHIDNFLLSCRVFSRGIEGACLLWVLRHARATGAGEVLAVYRPSARNGKVKDFYLRNGFTPARGEGGTSVFRHDLTEIAAPPEHVRLAEDLEGSPP